MNEQRVRRPHQVGTRTVLALVFLFGTGALAIPRVQAQNLTDAPSSAAQKPSLTAEEIVSHLQERNRERELALRKFESERVYRVHYQGFFGTREGEVVVKCNYSFPNQKQFEVVSQTGSKLIFDHVINGLLKGEQEAANEDNRRRTSLSSANYEFTLANDENAREPLEYVLNVSPKHNNKYLYRGKIWVDAKDFAVTRIEAEPAKSPSFWVKQTLVRHRYQKVGDFWLPAENESESFIRMGGRAVLSIEYKQYKITDSVPLLSTGGGDEKHKPEPATALHPATQF